MLVDNDESLRAMIRHAVRLKIYLKLFD